MKKYFKLTKEQKKKLKEINGISPSKINVIEYNGYLLVDYAYINEPEYHLFHELLNSCEIVELDITATPVNSTKIDNAELKLQTLLTENETLSQSVETLQLQLNSLQTSISYLNDLQAKIELAQQTNDTLKQSVQDLEQQINNLSNQLNKKK